MVCIDLENPVRLCREKELFSLRSPLLSKRRASHEASHEPQKLHEKSSSHLKCRALFHEKRETREELFCCSVCCSVCCSLLREELFSCKMQGPSFALQYFMRRALLQYFMRRALLMKYKMQGSSHDIYASVHTLCTRLRGYTSTSSFDDLHLLMIQTSKCRARLMTYTLLYTPLQKRFCTHLWGVQREGGSAERRALSRMSLRGVYTCMSCQMYVMRRALHRCMS